MKILKITVDKMMFMILFLVGFLGLVFYSNQTIMNAVIAIECLILIYCFLSRKNEYFICFLLGFITMSQEFSYFLENGSGTVDLYSFKETRIFGLNLALIFVSLFFLKILLFDNAINIVRNSKQGFRLLKWLFIISFSAFVIGFINILINNNGIANLPNVWKEFLQESSYGFYVSFLAFELIYVIVCNGFELIKKTIITIIECNLILPLIISFMGISGYYGGKTLYLTLSVYMLCVFIIIFAYYDLSHTYKYYVFFALCVIYPLLFKSIAFGKLLLLVAFAVVLFLYLKSKKSITWFLGALIIFAGIFIGWGFLIDLLVKNNDLFSYKYKQIISLISIWNPDWYDNMLPSPKVRITELFNIILELIKNPIYLLCGKGTLGTVKDYMGDIPLFNLSVYSYNEFSIQSYYGMHESLNMLLLSNGLFGVAFIFYCIKVLIKNIRNNPFIVIGGVWFIVLWGYSITRATLGIACFCLGLLMVEEGEKD